MPSYDESASDVDLMRCVAAGGIDAFEILVRRHQRAVYGTALKMLGDAAEAEDIAQQTFIRAFQAARGYKPSAKFTTWLFTILRNLVFSELRRRQRRKLESLDAPAHPWSEDESPREWPDTEAGDPHAELVQAELEVQIQQALAALPEQQRLAIVLLRYEELSYDEIARVLGTTVPAVKSLIFRGRTVLRDRLKRYLRASATSSETER